MTYIHKIEDAVLKAKDSGVEASSFVHISIGDEVQLELTFEEFDDFVTNGRF